MKPPLRTRLAGNSRPIGAPPASTPPKSPSLAITRPEGLTTTISSDWLAASQRLSCSSRMSPSQPLTLLTKTAGVPAAPSVTGTCTTESLPVLQTKSVSPALLKARPLAPNGGTPVVVSRGLCAHAVETPPRSPVRQIAPWNESET